MRDLRALLRDQRPTLVMARRQAAVTGELRVESIAGVAAALFNSSAWRANPSANAHEQRQSSPATIAARAAPMPSDLMVPKQQAGAAGHARWDPDLIEISEIKKSRSVRESTRKASKGERPWNLSGEGADEKVKSVQNARPTTTPDPW